MKARQVLFASLLAGTLASTGCSTGTGFSLASMNPFSKPAAPTVEATPGTFATVSDSIASTTNGTRNQLASLKTTAKSAFSKTRGAVSGLFGGEPAMESEMAANDPLSLANKPASISPEVFVANGQLWESTGDFNKAMESYAKALQSEPNNGPALTSIARLHYRQKNHEQAAEYFRRAIQQSPNEPALHNDLGLTYNALGNHAGAIASLSKALELAPGTSRYANHLAKVKFEAGEAPAAFQVLARNNKPAVAHFNMAYLFFSGGQLAEAKKHLGEAIKFQSEAASDPSIKQAVERSRDMLAQINASLAPIAQAAPQAKIAGGQLFGGKGSEAVKQISQTDDQPANVAPAASLGVTTSLGGTATPPTAAPPRPTKPAAPIKPTESPEPSASKAAEEPVQAADPSEGPSLPFAMPEGFNP